MRQHQKDVARKREEKPCDDSNPVNLWCGIFCLKRYENDKQDGERLEEIDLAARAEILRAYG